MPERFLWLGVCMILAGIAAPLAFLAGGCA